MAGVLSAAGWTANDWELLQLGWGGADIDLFNSNRMAKAASALVAGGPRSPLARTRRVIYGLRNESLGDVLLRMSVLVLVVFILAVGAGDITAMLIAVALVVEFAAMTMVIEAAFRPLPLRLFAPLQVCVFGVVAAAIAERPRADLRWLKVVAVVGAAGLLAVQSWSALEQAAAEIRHARSIDPQVDALVALHPSLVVLHSDAFPMEHWWRPFRMPPLYFPMVRLGGTSGSPLLEGFLRRTGRPQLLRSICSDPTIVLVADRPGLDVATRYMQEHAGQQVTWDLLFDGSFRVWRCAAAPQAR